MVSTFIECQGTSGRWDTHTHTHRIRLWTREEPIAVHVLTSSLCEWSHECHGVYVSLKGMVILLLNVQKWVNMFLMSFIFVFFPQKRVKHRGRQQGNEDTVSLKSSEMSLLNLWLPAPNVWRVPCLRPTAQQSSPCVPVLCTQSSPTQNLSMAIEMQLYHLCHSAALQLTEDQLTMVLFPPVCTSPSSTVKAPL